MTPQRTTIDTNVMQPAADDRRSLWAGRILTGFGAAFLAVDGAVKLFKPAFVVKATTQLGYPESTIVGIGAALLACTLLYVIPRTSLLGAILLTAYLGGAVASNVRTLGPLFNIVFPIIFAVLLWAGLWLRNRQFRSLVPINLTL